MITGIIVNNFINPLSRVLNIAHLSRTEHGFTLIETLVALAILAITAVTFLSGLSIASKGVMVSQRRVTADTLAKSQMEYVKGSTYNDVDNPPVYDIDAGIAIPTGYGISVSAERLDPMNDGIANDDGLQKVTVIVSHEGEPLLTLVDYKLK